MEKSKNEQAGLRSDLAIEGVARGFYREAESFGFSQLDYVRFFNAVLAMSMASKSARSVEKLDAPPGPFVDLTKQAQGGLPLEGETVKVRRFESDRDTELLSRWLEDPKGRMFLLAGTMTRWLTLEEIIDDDASMLGIITLPDGTSVGATAFLDIRQDQRKAEMRKLIGEPEMRGRGLAKEATRLWIGFGLGTLDLHKIYINTLDTNIRNIRLNEALGFQLEGILRDEVILNGEFHDVLRMAIWRD